MTKKILFAAIDQLPDHFGLDELIDRLLLIERIERSREQNRNGEVVSFEEVKRQAASWRK